MLKITKTIFASVVLLTLVSVSAFAEVGVKVIAVVNQATWCPTCQNNGPRAEAVFMENNKDGAVQFVMNDLSNNETKQKSAEELKKVGLDKVMTNKIGTGVAYFFNAKTKELINQVSLAKTNEKLVAALETAKKGAK